MSFRLRLFDLSPRLLPFSVGLLLLGCHTQPADQAKRQGSALVQELPELQAELVKIEPRSWPTIVRTQGSLIADETTTVGAKVAGRVEVVHVDLGDAVRQGDPLVTLDQREFALLATQAEAQLTQSRAAIGLLPEDDIAQADPLKSPPVREAQALWDEARQQGERLRQLVEDKAISASEWEAAQAAERVAEARYASAVNNVRERLALIGVRTAELAVARQRLADIVTPAPFEGVVRSRLVSPGTYVQVGEPLVSLVSTRKLRFRGAVPERYAQSLQLGQQITLRIESIDEPCLVVISRLSPALDEATRSLLFEAELSNPDQRYRSGLFAEAEVVLDPRATALVIPSSAVVRFAGVEKVWRVVEGLAQEQPVQLGRQSADQIEVLSGLSPGDLILHDGREGRVARVISSPSSDKTIQAAE